MRDFNATAFISGIVFILLGVLFLFDRLGVIVVSSRYVWPIVLVAIGVAIIMGGGSRDRWRYRDHRHHRHHDGRSDDHGPDDHTPAT